MIERSKLETIGYVFLLTAVPQLAVWAVFFSTCQFAYLFSIHSSMIYMLIGTVSFIAMLFAFLCVAIFSKNYGMSIFSLTRKNFDVNDYHGDPIKKYEYRTGRRNTFTGKRPIYVIEKEEASGGPLLVTAIISIIIGFTGIFKFTLEAVRVMLSDQRQAEWEGCREFLIEKINEDGKIKFFNVPIIILGVFLISWVICIGASTVDKIIYDPGNINIEINEKINSENNSRRIHVLFDGQITNEGSVKIEEVSLCVYIKDRNGSILVQEDDILINVPFSTATPQDDLLEKDESWNFTLSFYADPASTDAQDLWNSSIDDLEISIDIIQVYYENDIEMSFPEKKLVVIKPIKD